MVSGQGSTLIICVGILTGYTDTLQKMLTQIAGGLQMRYCSLLILSDHCNQLAITSACCVRELILSFVLNPFFTCVMIRKWLEVHNKRI